MLPTSPPTARCIPPSEPTRTDTVQAQGGRGAGPAGCAALAHPDLVSRTHFPSDLTSLAHSSEEGSPPRRPPKMHDWSSAFFPPRKVGAVTLYLESACGHYRGSPRCSGKHDLIVRFLKGTRRMNPSRSTQSS